MIFVLVNVKSCIVPIFYELLLSIIFSNYRAIECFVIVAIHREIDHEL